MYSAIYNNNKITIDTFTDEMRGGIICPCCNSEVIPKRGSVNAHHFAHKTLSQCDQWYEMSEWHKGWQSQFKEEFREVVMTVGDEKHRADVKINHLVIEFQNSPISTEDFEARNSFYTADGSMLIWVFNGNHKEVSWKDGSLEWKRMLKLWLSQRTDNVRCFVEKDGILYGLQHYPVSNYKYSTEDFIKMMRILYKDKNFSYIDAKDESENMYSLSYKVDDFEKNAALIEYFMQKSLTYGTEVKCGYTIWKHCKEKYQDILKFFRRKFYGVKIKYEPNKNFNLYYSSSTDVHISYTTELKRILQNRRKFESIDDVVSYVNSLYYEVRDTLLPDFDRRYWKIVQETLNTAISEVYKELPNELDSYLEKREVQKKEWIKKMEAVREVISEFDDKYSYLVANYNMADLCSRNINGAIRVYNNALKNWRSRIADKFQPFEEI